MIALLPFRFRICYSIAALKSGRRGENGLKSWEEGGGDSSIWGVFLQALRVYGLFPRLHACVYEWAVIETQVEKLHF